MLTGPSMQCRQRFRRPPSRPCGRILRWPRWFRTCAWRRPSPAQRATASSPAQAGPPAPVCPADPAKPLLEPEALSLKHTNSQSSSTPTARSLGYDGSGVKVAFIADGVDIDQPDFIRADGSHVFVDYQDFSGDGVNAATSGAEALGDASSIAAQGRVTYDISTFVNAAHPLPPGCTIRIEGMALGASLVGLKVFSNALLIAPTSTIIQAIDYAVSVDHVDVLNESFGSNPYPDNATPDQLAQPRRRCGRGHRDGQHGRCRLGQHRGHGRKRSVGYRRRRQHLLPGLRAADLLRLPVQ